MNTTYRFEIGVEGKECYDNVSTFADAGKVADALKSREPDETIYIYDRMAHVGKTELWHLVDPDHLQAVRVREN